MEKAAVLGSTPVGVSLAARLTLLGYRVTLLDRKGEYSELCFFHGWGHQLKLKTQNIAGTVLNDSPLLFVAVHTYDLLGCLERYLTYFSKGTVVVVMTCAGMYDAVCKVAQHAPQFMWRLGSSTMEWDIQSYRIFHIRREGVVFWGPLIGQGEPWQQPNKDEKYLFEKDPKVCTWQPHTLERIKEQWILDLTTHSISTAKGLTKNTQLLDHMSLLKATLAEAYALVSQLWGNPHKSYEFFLNHIVSYISARPYEENPMAKKARLKERLESDAYSLLASKEPPGAYPHLQSFHGIIEDKARQAKTRRNPPS